LRSLSRLCLPKGAVLIRAAPFRRALLGWYGRVQRDLPWRTDTPDFYRIWVSEIMLQQTRVEAVIPYYERFLARFPDVKALAAASESDVLTAWSGLGYYSRARNLHRGAKEAASNGLPGGYDELLNLSGIGPYTAAAIASIALGEPRAAVDGNVIRVISRLTDDASEVSSPVTKRRFTDEAQRLLDPCLAGDFNQAMMELGATVCVPRTPRCEQCPVVRFCAARAAGTEQELPVKLKKASARDIALDLALFAGRAGNAGKIFLVQRNSTERRLADFWELPEKNVFPKWNGRVQGRVTHQIVNDRFRITVWHGIAPRLPPSGKWFTAMELAAIPVTTVSRKALAVAASCLDLPLKNLDIPLS
jgi:A/G-specific adenine glycosylase